MTKYCTDSSYGTVDNKTELELSDDAARFQWRSPWRMPMLEECKELLNCMSVWITINGVNGRKFTGSNGASIFLPAAGGRWGGELYNAGIWGDYWLSTLDEDNPSYAYYLDFGSDNAGWRSYDRFRGRSVRPVR